MKEEIEKLIDNSQYDEACELVKKEFNIEIKMLSSRFGHMLWDKDDQKRYIFNVELKRNDKSYTFEFGSSIVNSTKKVSDYSLLKPADIIDFFVGVEFKTLEISVYNTFKFSLHEAENISSDTIESKAKELTTQYLKKYKEKYKGTPNNNELGSFRQAFRNSLDQKLTELKTTINHSKDISVDNPSEPRLYDIITCLTKYDPGTFEDFCWEFNYDNDSISALKTYNAVVVEYKNVAMLFNEDELEILNLIQ